MSEATQALCFLAGANSIFTGDKLLTAANAGDDKDAALFAKLGLTPLQGEEPMRACEAAGLRPRMALGKIALALAADADLFLTIAKFRAARRLVARVAEACGAGSAAAAIQLSASTSERMMARRDPWVNMLRTTVACAGAAFGGAEAITVLPFTWALGKPDAFARRIARNTQLILLDESNLSRVADPAAGSGGFEALTDALCEKAWGLFQEIEREGGILESLKEDKLQARIAAVRTQREKAIATRKEPMAFPIFGRGRTLGGLIGAGITEENVAGMCGVLVAPCSCKFKFQSPGFDLLISTDWESFFEKSR